MTALPAVAETQRPYPKSMASEFEAFLEDLRKHVLLIAAHPPPEPCTDEAHFLDIPIRDWSLALRTWCASPQVRRRHSSWADGLMAVLDDAEEHGELANFVFDQLRDLTR